MAITLRCPSCESLCTFKERVPPDQRRCPQCGNLFPAVDAATAARAAKGARPAFLAPAVEPVERKDKRELPQADIDMTPMVDVVFQLLIFFMVTAAFALQKSLEIPKPKQEEASTQAVQQDPEEDPNYVTVFVDEFSTYRVITVDWDVEAPSEQDLLRKLREARNGDSAGRIPTRLLVKAHGDSLHERVIAALDAGTEVGMEQVQLLTVEESQ